MLGMLVSGLQYKVYGTLPSVCCAAVLCALLCCCAVRPAVRCRTLHMLVRGVRCLPSSYHVPSKI